MIKEYIFVYDVLDGYDLESEYSKKGTSRTRRCRRERQIANEQRQSQFTVHPEHCGRGCSMGPTCPALFVIFIVEIHLSKLIVKRRSPSRSSQR